MDPQADSTTPSDQSADTSTPDPAESIDTTRAGAPLESTSPDPNAKASDPAATDDADEVQILPTADKLVEMCERLHALTPARYGVAKHALSEALNALRAYAREEEAGCPG